MAAPPVPLEDRFKPIEGITWRERIGIPSRAPVIGSVGKLADGRGFRRLLDTASRLKEPAHVVVVGHGELQPLLEAYASDLGLERRVHWAGYQDEALPEFYSAMDIVLFQSPGSDWGHRMISEAQGCGRPIVAVSCSGVADLVEDGITGRIVNRNPAALVSAVDSLIADPEIAHRYVRAATAAAEGRRFVQVGRSLAQFLDAVLSRKQLH